MKKFTAILVALLVACSMFFGVAAGAKTITKIKVGLSTDEGGLNDKSFNQAANTGITKAAKELGLDYKAVESKVKEDYEPNLQALVDNGDNLVFGVGFQMGDALTNIAKKNTETKFAMIDSVVALPNVESINFKAEESSFLVGVIAGKMTKTNKVGFIGGKDMPLINAFEYGYYAGVKSVNPKAAALLLARKNVIYADSFTDTNKGYEAGKQLYSKGCDIVYHAAGGVGIGLFQIAKELKVKNKNIWAIGVDLDQAAVLPKFSNVILTSAMKRVDISTYTVTKDMQNGKFKGGATVYLGLKEGGVGIPTVNKNVPAKVLKIVTKYSNLIKAGKIKVPTDKKTATAFKAVTVK
jgi:basic membrane protein A